MWITTETPVLSREKQSNYKNDFKGDQYDVGDDMDIIQEFRLDGRVGSGEDEDKFDNETNERREVHLCSLCVWIQPNFAAKFGLGAGMEHGVSEIINLISFLNWGFQGLDFNNDGIPVQIGFVVKEILVSDSISAEVGELDGSNQPDDYSKRISRITTKSAMLSVSKHFKKQFKGCSVTLGFIYHNMAPAFAATNLRGLCTEKSTGIISGYLHAHKITKFDVYRGMMHVMGHLFGSYHDIITRKRCLDPSISNFINPFLMHPVQMLNVGIRPNSFRLSDCSKLQISQFMSTIRPGCFQKLQSRAFSGNGIQEVGEECDCGSPFQCQIKIQCCGESDNLLACKINW